MAVRLMRDLSLPDECTKATASRLNSGVYRLLVLLFLLTTWNCFLRDRPSQYQAVQATGGTSLPYLSRDSGHYCSTTLAPRSPLNGSLCDAASYLRARQEDGSAA